LAWKQAKENQDEAEKLLKSILGSVAVGHAEKARDLLKSAIEDDPTNLEAQFTLAVCQRMIGGHLSDENAPERAEAYAEAKAILEMLTRFNPSVSEFQAELARLEKAISNSEPQDKSAKSKQGNPDQVQETKL
jgi:tetratricopeptide (TPR) repeat protein